VDDRSRSRLGAEFVITSAWEPMAAEVSPGEFEVLRREAQDQLEQWGHPARGAGALKVLHHDAQLPVVMVTPETR
jgi:hypothetical protein